MYFWTITCRMFLFFSIVAWQPNAAKFFYARIKNFSVLD